MTVVRVMVNGLPIVYEDEQLLVIDKPPGLLSQPGKTISDSALTRVQSARQDARGSLLVHRLDMDTSGLLLFALSKSSHRLMQQQFEHRRVGKQYRAILSQTPIGLGGRINMPVRADIDRRPYQIRCQQHGKSSETVWYRVTDNEVVLIPLTGRTHQLRVHMAHKAGLGIPILGDRLYGQAGERLMLHAERLVFDHPVTGQRVCLESIAPFASYSTRKPLAGCSSIGTTVKQGPDQ